MVQLIQEKRVPSEEIDLSALSKDPNQVFLPNLPVANLATLTHLNLAPNSRRHQIIIQTTNTTQEMTKNRNKINILSKIEKI